MAGTTTELALSTAVDTDDTADYLTLNLANSLRTIDALFNNVTGHTHASAHQGGPIAASSVRGPMDIVDWFRSTGHTTAYAGSGVGIEMFWNGTQGVLQSRNAATAAFAPVVIYGTTITLGINGGASLSIAADQTISTATSATIGGNLTVGGGLVGNSNLSIAGTTSVTTLTASGAVTVTGTLTGGTVNSSGGINSTARITSGTDLVVGNGVIYVGSQGDTTLSRDAANSVHTSGHLTVGGNLTVSVNTTVGGGLQVNGGGTINGNLTVQDGVTGISINMSGTLGTWQKSNRSGASAGESQIANYLYVPGDINAGLRMYAISFNQTSDPRLKANLTPMADTACMARVRNPGLAVQTYQMAVPPDIVPAPTANEIGFDAVQMAAVNPEMVSYDVSNNPVTIGYPNLTALLWGALRDLDKRCTAYGIPA